MDQPNQSSNSSGGGGMGLVGGLLGLGSSGMSAWSNANQNRKSRDFSMQNWGMQNQLDQFNWNQQNEYNERQWQKQNQYDQFAWNAQNKYNEQRYDIENKYNSPMAQMQRYKEAGLNPNLIYGQGNTGGSIGAANMDMAQQPQADKRSSGPASTPRNVPNNWNFGNPLMDMLDLKQKSAQIDNVQAQTDAVKENTVLTSWKQISEMLGGQRKSFDLGVLQDTRDASVDIVHQRNRNLKQEFDLRNQKNSRDKQLNQASILKILQEITNMRTSNSVQDVELKLKQYEDDLHQEGIQSNDGMVPRMLLHGYHGLKDAINKKEGNNSYKF